MNLIGSSWSEKPLDPRVVVHKACSIVNYILSEVECDQWLIALCRSHRCHYPFATQLSHAVFAGFHIRHAKRIMASLDDLEVQRVKPFERLCFVMYVVLYMIFVFMALSFVKLLTDSR